MTIQDLSNILTIMEEKSINKAAVKLFTSQPSLSKCVKKVEQEYGIVLFERSKGSALTLTDEGLLFREMGQNMLSYHRQFEHRMEQIRARNENSIVLGAPMQRAYDLSGPLMKWIYRNYPGMYLELRTQPSRNLMENLLAGDIDMAVMANLAEDPRLYAYPLAQSDTYIYLRKGSPAVHNAHIMPGERFPVLSLQDIRNELIVDNVMGSGSRKNTERIMENTGIRFSITEQPVHAMRVAMVDSGDATMFVTEDAISRGDIFHPEQLYALPEAEKMRSTTYLVCMKGFQKNRKFEIIQKALLAYYEISKTGFMQMSLTQ